MTPAPPIRPTPASVHAEGRRRRVDARRDQHPDHQAVSRAVGLVGGEPAVTELLLWAPHRTDPGTVSVVARSADCVVVR